MSSTMEISRTKVDPIPRLNTREVMDESGEWWHRKAIMRLSDVEAILGPRPEDCTNTTLHSSRRCDACGETDEWDTDVIELVNRATDWALIPFGCNSAHMTGRAFAAAPSVYRHARHPGVLVVSWSGGIDI